MYEGFECYVWRSFVNAAYLFERKFAGKDYLVEPKFLKL